MLRTNKSTTLTGQVHIGEELVAILHATISVEEGSSHISKTVQNQLLYSENLEQCRKDMDAFTKEVRAIEDATLSKT